MSGRLRSAASTVADLARDFLPLTFGNHGAHSIELAFVAVDEAHRASMQSPGHRVGDRLC